jgi:protein phosphatase
VTELRWGSATDEGRVREINEDSFLADDSLWAVADGMGGHAAGEVASAIAVQTLREHAGPSADEIVEAMRLANRAVVEQAGRDPSMRGMGTTLSVVALVPGGDDGASDEIVVANVGDSRVYRLHDGELEQLTDDHSLVGDLVRAGRITPAEARVHPNRNIVTKVIGNEDDVVADSWIVDPHAGDRYLLCSDGLTDEVEDVAIARVLRATKDPSAAAKELVDLANAAGGRDNITAVIVDVVDDGGRGEAASAVLAREPGRTTSAPMVHEGPGGGPHTAAVPAVTRERLAKPRRLTWRVAVFIVAIVVVLGVAVGGTIWFARNTYYVGVDKSETVTIYRGRPGGVLFIKPTVEDRTEFSVGDVEPSRRDEVEQGHEVSSRALAERYVRNIVTTTTTSTTTTTTSTTSTTTPPPTPTSTP